MKLETPTLKVGDVVMFNDPHTVCDRQYVVTRITSDGTVGTMVERRPNELHFFNAANVKKIVE